MNLEMIIDPMREERERKKRQRIIKRRRKRARQKAVKSATPKQPRHKRKVHPFFNSIEWKMLRYKVLKRDNATCQCCGRSAKDGFVMNVDHILPRRKFPALAMEIANLQTLCASCNAGKLEWDYTDWRGEQDPLTAEYRAILDN